MSSLHVYLPIVLALLATLLLVVVAERRGPGPLRGAPVLGGLILLGLYAGGVWYVRRYDFSGGVAAGLYVVGALILTGLTAMLTPRVPQEHPADSYRKNTIREATITAGSVLWLAIIVLALLLFVNYFLV